jgi:GTPase involved in cell partitioning and DNA repair
MSDPAVTTILSGCPQAERQKLVSELTSADKEINKIKSKFERQLQRLREKERFLVTNRADCVAEEATLKVRVGSRASLEYKVFLMHKHSGATI